VPSTRYAEFKVNYFTLLEAVQKNKKCGEREVAARIGETLTLAPFRGSSGKKDEVIKIEILNYFLSLNNLHIC